MPPKKIRKLSAPSQPGKARQFLQENFSSVPSENMKNGHALYVFLQCNKSLTETVLTLKRELIGNWKITTNSIMSLVNRSLKRYPSLSSERIMSKFKEVCEELFPLVPEPSQEPVSCEVADPHHEPESPELTQPELEAGPSAESEPSTSTRSSKPEALTPRKQKLKRRLQYVSKEKSAEKLKYKKTIRDLKSSLKSTKVCQIKHLTQQIKRQKLTIEQKNKVISELRRSQCGKLQAELARLRNTHRKMKRYYKLRSQRSRSHTPDPSLRANDQRIAELQQRNEQLQENVEELEDIVKSQKESDVGTSFQKSKSYPTELRLMFYDGIVNNVPTNNASVLIGSILNRVGVQVDSLPHRNTVELMTRELGALSDLLVGETLMTVPHLTVGFDATTQEGVHINSVHVTTKEETLVMSVDELPGGTAADYAGHVNNTIRHIASVYSSVYNLPFEDCRLQIIKNIDNTMSDRAPVNHAAISLLESEWGKMLNELNCNLHPLDTIASMCRGNLKAQEQGQGKVFGRECMAANIIWAMNTVRYKDGKGDPKAFKLWLNDSQLGSTFIPRYRGNRLHILFDISAKYYQYYDVFQKFLNESLLNCATLQKALAADFGTEIARIEFQVLGLVCVLLSGPWMKRYYKPAGNVNHVEAFGFVKTAITCCSELKASPGRTLTTAHDVFGEVLTHDERLACLQSVPSNLALFNKMMVSCLDGIVSVLERQYTRYFSLKTDADFQEVISSARLHNMDSEEVMGMFSAAQSKAPSATLDYHSSKIRAKKNKVVMKLDGMNQKSREDLVGMCINIARKQRDSKRSWKTEVTRELKKRMQEKARKREMQSRRKLEKRLKSATFNVDKDLGAYELSVRESVKDIMEGLIVGRNILHVWLDEGERSIYNGKVMKLIKQKEVYCVSYWKDSCESEEEAVDYDVPKYELAADFISNDLYFC